MSTILWAPPFHLHMGPPYDQLNPITLTTPHAQAQIWYKPNCYRCIKIRKKIKKIKN